MFAPESEVLLVCLLCYLGPPNESEGFLDSITEWQFQLAADEIALVRYPTSELVVVPKLPRNPGRKMGAPPHEVAHRFVMHLPALTADEWHS